MRGLELSENFYREAAKPILEMYFPTLQYSAAILGWSSEVLGYDDEESRDHNWGPRFQMFLDKPDYDISKVEISRVFSEKLPAKFCGFPTNFDLSQRGDQQTMAKSESIGRVNHKIDFATVEDWFKDNFGIEANEVSTLADWLILSEQKLLALTSGRVFYDGLDKLESLRQKFAYYPDEVWLYLLVSQWKKLAAEEAFVGRAGFVGDELGSAIIAARIVRNLMYLCFLMERKYAPYAKWFGTAFSRLQCAWELQPIFRAVLLSENWQLREANLSKAYEAIARLHNEMGITEPLPNKVSPHGRPYLVIHASWFADAIWEKISIQEIIEFRCGSVNQLIEQDDEIADAILCQKLKGLYQLTEER